MKKRLLLIGVLLTFMLTEAGAVLKEKDLQQTLAILKTELLRYNNELKERTQVRKQHNKRIIQELVSTMKRADQNALMLYSQQQENVFDLTYACHEATEQYHEFHSRQLPFKTFLSHNQRDIARYDSLINSLKVMPDKVLGKEGVQKRDSCVMLAENIRVLLQDGSDQLERYITYYDRTENRLSGLNDYAQKRYSDIKQSVFINGSSNYFTLMSRFSRNWNNLTEAMEKKYNLYANENSDWSSQWILGTFIAIGVFVLVAILLNQLFFRLLLPKRFDTPEYRKKRPAIIMATTTVTFALIQGIFVNNTGQNFLVMASTLLVEYAWLLGVILISLLLRVDGDQVRSAFRVYSPLIVISFIVIVFRIILVPNELVNMLLPPILLCCALWQWSVIRRHNKNIPRSDMFYSYISLTVFISSVVCAWSGFTLLAVQLLIWWIMQLTLIQTITVIYDLMHSYENKYIPKSADVRRTWFYDAVYKMIIPIAATLSVALSIYWAARVFDLTQWCEHIFRYKFVDQPGLIVLSLDRILACVAFAFVFQYIIYLFIQGYQLWKQNRAEAKAISVYERDNEINDNEVIDIETVIQDNPDAKAQVKAASKAVTLSMNIIKYIGWGIYIYIVLVTLHVNRTGITFILTGLSTGIGFAMKDTLENLFYGLSLMNGRVKIGDVIECDGVRGKVSNINYQSTLVETVDGSVIAFLNSQLFTKNFKNMTRNHGYEMAKITVGVAYGSKIDAVREMIIRRLEQLNCYDTKKGIQVLFQNFGESSVDLLIIIWVRVKSQAADVALVKENIYSVLNENGIEIPFPQADLHIRTALPVKA